MYYGTSYFWMVVVSLSYWLADCFMILGEMNFHSLICIFWWDYHWKPLFVPRVFPFYQNIVLAKCKWFFGFWQFAHTELYQLAASQLQLLYLLMLDVNVNWQKNINQGGKPFFSLGWHWIVLIDIECSFFWYCLMPCDEMVSRRSMKA